MRPITKAFLAVAICGLSICGGHRQAMASVSSGDDPLVRETPVKRTGIAVARNGSHRISGAGQVVRFPPRHPRSHVPHRKPPSGYHRLHRYHPYGSGNKSKLMPRKKRH